MNNNNEYKLIGLNIKRLYSCMHRTIPALALIALLEPLPGMAAAPVISCSGTELQSAISDANAYGKPQVPIVLTPGCRYQLTEQLEVSVEMYIVGNNATIDANASDVDNRRVFRVTDTGNLTLNHLTVTGGNVANLSTDAVGAAIFNRGGKVALNDVTLKNNKADKGGGIYNSANGILAINGGKITENRADQGGGMYNFSGTVILHKLRVENNEASTSGGGVFNWFGELNINGGNISDNTAGGGGGIVNSRATLTLNGVRAEGNEAITSNGGGIVNDMGTVNTNKKTVITGNHAVVYGGGIYNEKLGSLDAILNLYGKTDVSENTADGGGNEVYNNGGTVNTNKFTDDISVVEP